MSILRVPWLLRRAAFALGWELPNYVAYRNNVRISVFGFSLDIHVGRQTVADLRVRCGARGRSLTIGSYCGIARSTVIIGVDHHDDITWSRLRDRWRGEEEPVQAHDVTIGHDAYVGEDVILMGRTTIANGAVVGARALVKGPVPPYAIVGGVPAEVIRWRFPAEEIRILQEAPWWELPPSVIDRHLDLFYGRDVRAVRELVRRHLGK